MHEIAASSGASSGQVDVTLTVAAPSTAPPGVAQPGVSVPGSPTHLAFTGAPVAAEVDLALIVVVAGMTLVTASRHLGRVAARRGSLPPES